MSSQFRDVKKVVHILELLGCIANGPTTEEALSGNPVAIDVFWTFLARHGAAVDVNAEMTTEVASHITEGMWLGQGDPSLAF